MKPTPASRRWVGALGVAGATVAVIILTYVALVRPDAAVVTGTGQEATVEPSGGLHRPEAATEMPDTSSPGAAAPAPVGTGVGASNMPMPTGDLTGWRQTFADDFSGTSLGKQWFSYEGQPDGDPGGYFDPAHVSVGGGRLTLAGFREPTRGNIYATGGVSVKADLAQTYGRYEVRFRMDLGVGLAYALLLWPKSNNFPPEIDFAEDNGKDRRTMFASLHPPEGGRNISRSVAGDFTQWHTAGLEWTPGMLVFTLDGEQWATIPGSSVPDEPMTLALQSQAWYCGQTWEACPDSSTPARVNLEIDWAVMYARVG